MNNKNRHLITRRQAMKVGAGALAATFGTPMRAPLVLGQAKQFAGTTINVSCWSAPYPKWLAEYLPEFEQATGMKVNYETPSFPIYNQKVDLELSTKGSAYDVANVTFIYTARWIGANWFTPLEPFIEDSSKTPAGWDVDDILEGVKTPMRNKEGKLFGIPWIADCYISAASRFDMLKAEGLGMPQTMDELEAAAKAVHRKQGVSGFINENHHGWTFIPYLMAFGGGVFRNPPDDLMPVLDTPEAIHAAEWYSNLLKNYGPSGVLSITYDQMIQLLKLGRANLTTHNHAFLLQLGAQDSRVGTTCNFDLVPAGPKGRFPGVASHGWGIPVGSKNKDAAWAFIVWSMSKQLLQRMLVEKGYGSITRRSVIDSPDFKKKNLVNGVDLADLYLKTIDMASKGYMAYRTVHIYPQVDQQLNKVIELITSGQMTAEAAMKQAQANSIAEIRRAGVNI